MADAERGQPLPGPERGQHPARVLLAVVTNQDISAPELLALVTRADAGAVTMFVGVVRDHDPEASGTVVALDYTAHPSAPAVMVDVVNATLATADPEGDCHVAVAHRIGHLLVGDKAFVVAVSAPHRDLAFEVCRQLVERVKAELPVWKQQFSADGTYGWPGLGA